MMLPALSAVGGLLVLLLSQDPEALVERLRSGSPAEREEAVGALKALGETAEPALKKAVEDPDVDVAALAKRLLQRLLIERSLGPRLKATFPGLSDRLTSSDSSWVEALEEALKREGRPGGLRRPDIVPLVERALSAPVPDLQLRRILHFLGNRGYEEAAPWVERLALGAEDEGVRSSAVEALKQLRSEASVPRFIRVLDGGSDAERVRALEGLKRLGGWEATPSAIRALASRSHEVRRASLEFLSMSRRPQAVPPELKVLFSDARPDLRWLAVPAAEQLDPQGAEPYVESLLRDDHPSVRQAAVRWIARAPEASSRRFLTLALGDGESGVRSAALSALVERRGPDVLGALLRAAKDADEDIRRVAARELGRHPAASAALLELTRDVDEEVRFRAFESCSRLGVAAALAPALQVLSRDHTETSLRYGAILVFWRGDASAELRGLLEHESALIRLMGAAGLLLRKDPAGIRALEKVLEDPDAEARGTAARIAQVLGVRSAAVRVTEMLGDPGAGVRSAAEEALKWGLEPDVPGLIRLSNHDDPEVRKVVLRLLSEVDVPRLEIVARRCLSDRDAGVRYGAVMALAEAGLHRAVDEIGTLLADEDEDVRGRAASSLGDLGAAAYGDEVRRLLLDGSPAVRRGALDGLKALGLEREEDLLPLAADPYTEVRRRALDGLSRCGGKASLKVLEEAAWALDEEAREAAVRGLGRIAGAEFRDRLRELLRDASSDVRMEAADVLSRIGEPEDLVRIVRSHRGFSFREGDCAVLLRRWAVRDGALRIAALLDSPLMGERRAAAVALGLLDDPAGVTALSRAAESEDADVREAALASLGGLAFPEGEAAVRRGLSDPRLDVRAAAARACADGAFGGAWEDLVRCLRDPERRMRVLALRSMSVLRPAVLQDSEFLARCEGEEDGLAANLLHHSPMRSEAALSVLRAWVPEDPMEGRSERARALCRQGSDEEIEWVLRDEKDPACLNAVRSPELWLKLASTPWEGPDLLPVDVVPAKVAERMGLAYRPTPRRAVGYHVFVRSRGTKTSLLEALDWGHGSWCVVDGELRMMTSSEAHRFWRGWLESRKERR